MEKDYIDVRKNTVRDQLLKELKVIEQRYTKEHKPSPVPFKMALKQLKITPDEALMIGDWPDRDVVGAKKVGIKTIFARYGDTSDIKNSGADWEVDDIYEVVRIVDELNGV